MKDLGPARKIFEMTNFRYRKNKLLTLSKEDYIEQVVKRFGFIDVKTVNTPLGAHFKLYSLIDREAELQEKQMQKVPYSNCVGSTMYSMVSTRPDITYGIGLVSRFMSRPATQH